jgi:hypothetical protein
MPAQSHVRWFDEIGLDDIPEVGGKTASLGELCSALGSQGIRVPDGFALTAACYREALDAAGAWDALRRLLAEFDHRDVALWPSGPPPPAVSSMTRRGHPACVTKFWRLTARSKENAGRASPSRCAYGESPIPIPSSITRPCAIRGVVRMPSPACGRNSNRRRHPESLCLSHAGPASAQARVAMALTGNRARRCHHEPAGGERYPLSMPTVVCGQPTMPLREGCSMLD